MGADTESTSVEDLFYKTRDYVNTRIDLLKLKSIKRASAIYSSTLTFLFLGGILFLVILFLSVGFALYLGHLLGETYYGFFIVAGIYIIAGLVFYALRKSLLNLPFRNWLIKNLID